jgi:cellulose synthase operon protein C
MRTTKFRVAWAILGVLSLSACDWFVGTEERIDRAAGHVSAGDYRAAFIDLQNAVRAEPNNVRARGMLADLSLKLGDLKAAEREVAAARANGATPSQVAELLARIRLARGEFKLLLEELENSSIQLVEPALSTYKGTALLALEQVPLAIAAFESALSSDAAWHQARIGLAEALLASGTSDEGAAEIEKVLAADPTNAIGWWVMSKLCRQRGDVQGAISALKRANEHAPGRLTLVQHNTTLATLVEAQMESGDIAGAAATHADLAKRSPEAPLTRLLAARLAILKREYSTAIAESQKALGVVPDFVPARLMLAAALLANGNINQAGAELSELLRQAPDNFEARKLLAQVNLRLHRPTDALEILQSRDIAGREDPQVDALLGLAKLAEGDERAAIALMERSLRAQPENSSARMDLALAYLRAGEHAKAKDLLRAHESKVGTPRRAALLIAAVAAADGQQAAIAEVERILAADGKDIGVLNVAASFFVEHGDTARARTYSERALAIDPKNATTLMTRARIASISHDLAAARTFLQRVLESDPSNSAARIALAQLALRSADQEDAAHWLQEVRSADPNAGEARMMLAAIHLQQNKIRDAEQIFREVWSAAENKAHASSAIGKLLAQAGRYDDALRRFREASQHEGSNPEHLLDIGRVQSALGNHVAARESTLRAVSLRPDDMAANATLAMIDARAGNHDAVRVRIERLKKVYPEDARVAVLQGDVAVLSRNYPEAVEAFARGYILQPSKAIALREYRARKLGGIEDAEAPLKVWLTSHPRDHDVRLLMAEAYAARGERRSAINHYELIVLDAPSSAATLNNLAWMYFEEGDARAEAMAKKAFDLAPGVAAIADTYGWILVRNGKPEAGLPVLERAAATSSTSPEIHYHFAAALSAVGERERARAALHSLLATHDDFSEANAARDLLEDLGG